MDRIARDRLASSAGNGTARHDHRAQDEPSISDLFRRVTSDASLLVRQEISLARAELQESGTRMKEAARIMAIAVLLAIPGALALTAFLVIALGQAFGSYWLSALLVGAVLVGTSAIYARRSMERARTGAEPVQRAAQSLGEDARWGKEELRTFKRELTA
jgi:uncharacterized membrane protein YqjE